MKICVCSDTHGDSACIEKMVQKERPEALLFLGDGLRDLARASLPPETAVFSVRGNCDFAFPAPLERIVTLDGQVFYLTHGHEQGVKYGLSGLKQASPAGTTVALYGHTHIADVQTDDGCLYLCPGSLGAPGRSYAVLETQPELRYGMRMLGE